MWTYRAIRYKNGSLAVHEVYYSEEGEPVAITEHPVSIYADEEEGLPVLRDTLRMIKKDLRLPILDFDSFTEEKMDKFTKGFSRDLPNNKKDLKNEKIRNTGGT